MYKAVRLVWCVAFSEHEWFKIDLPEYLFPSASDVDASVVDTDAIREVCEVDLLFVNWLFDLHAVYCLHVLILI
jgi:hypothetical protein